MCQWVDRYLECIVESGDKNSSHTVLNDCQSSIKPIQGQRSLRAGSNKKRKKGREAREEGGGCIVPSGRYSDSSDGGHCFGSLKAGHILHFPAFFFPLIKRLFVRTEQSPSRWYPPA